MTMDLDAPPDPVTPPAPSAPAPVAPPAAPVDPDEAVAVEVSGAKMVPLSALKQVREDMKPLKEKAAQYDQIKGEWEKAAPTIKFLQENPQFLTGRPPEAPRLADPAVDPELVELARSLDYYDQTGQPDVKRAEKHMQIIQRQAQKIADARVGPVEQVTAHERATQNWGWALQQKTPTGQPIDPNILAEVWREMPTERLADRRVAQVVLNQAKVMQMERSPLGQPPAPPPNPPLHTEGTGNAPPRRAALNDLDRRIMENSGMTEDKFHKLTDGFTRGRPSVLED